MNRESIRGLKDVFRFTLIQTLKSKSYIVTLVFICILSMVAFPVMSIVKGGAISNLTGGNGQAKVSEIEIVNETEFSLMNYKNAIQSESGNAKITIQDKVSLEEEQLNAKLNELSGNNALIKVSGGADLKIDIYTGKEFNADQSLLENAAKTVYESVAQCVNDTYGIDKAKQDILNRNFEITTIRLGEEVKEDSSIGMSEWSVMYAALFFVMMLVMVPSSTIASNIAQEKSSKVIEYIITSVKPMALILGKIFAAIVSTIIKMVALLICGFVSSNVSEKLFGIQTADMLSDVIPKNVFENVTLLNIILCIIAIALGLMFYALFAGLCGTTVSRQEDTSESLKLFTLTILIGLYLDIAAETVMQSAGVNNFVKFAYLFPISSPFILPGALLVGKIEISTVIISIVLLLISIYLLIRFVAVVYEALILHNGNRLKTKEVIALYKNVKKSKKEEKQ